MVVPSLSVEARYYENNWGDGEGSMKVHVSLFSKYYQRYRHEFSAVAAAVFLSGLPGISSVNLVVALLCGFAC